MSRTRTSFTRSITTTAITVGLVSVGLASAGLVANPSVAQQAPAAHKKQPTAFALKASGLGTKVEGGQLPVGSGPTAYTVIGCTNKAGLDRGNFVATADLGGAATAKAVRSHLWTTSKKGVVSSWSRHTVAKVILADTPLGSLQLTGVVSQARAYHDATGFHTDAVTKVGAITLVPAIGEPQHFDLPTPGQPIEIPGLAKISLGGSKESRYRTGAAVYADALRIEVLPTDTVIKVAHSRAEIYEGIKSGVFSGFSAGVEVNALGGVVKVGRNPLSLMPCQGTDGKARTKALAQVDPDSNLVVSAAKNTQFGKQTGKHKAWGYERSEIARVNLGNGALKINGIVGKATVHRTDGKVVRSSKGTTIGTITANGEPQTFPDTGVLEIPGVAKLEPNVVKKTRTGLHVIGLRITLLDGSGAVVNLAQAKLSIDSSHLR